VLEFLHDRRDFDHFAREYRKSSALYYRGQPEFDQLLARIKEHLDSM
jgi:hypothetical protein